MANKPAVYSRDSDLTGLWSGEYWYDAVNTPTPFTAHFVDTGGSLTGTTLEPNTFANAGGQEISADIRGARGDLSVRFTKLYHPSPGVHQHPIIYVGEVDADFTMIDGEWTFSSMPEWRGRFVLVRVSHGAKALEVEAEKAAA